MSDAVKDEFQKNLEAAAELERKKKEVQEKELLVREKRVDVDLERIIRTTQEIEQSKNTDFGTATEDYINNLTKENTEYIEAAQNGMEFINESFDSVVPFFRKNLIVIGGKTGEGKSTAVANIVHSVLKQHHPVTGKPRRCLVITNEEKAEDVYNRVVCMGKGWAYTNHDKFTADQLSDLNKGIRALAASGLLMVIDDIFNGVPGTTTTLEGIKNIFDNLLKNNQFFDCIIIDYYQNIKYSKNDPRLDQYKIQEMISTELHLYKNIYPAPIVIFAQVKPPDQQDTPFNIRIKGSKALPDRATLVMEMIADRKNRRTEWIVHKSRFTESLLGEGFHTGYDKGKFVPYDQAFKARVLMENERRQQQELLGLANVFDEKKDDKDKKEE